jgi:cytochrome c-type biogenesis protein CcmH/NrfF
MSQKDVDKYNIKECSCGESEFLQVLNKFNKKQVHCVNCGNNSFAMSTAEKAVKSWNDVNRFGKTPEQ